MAYGSLTGGICNGTYEALRCVQQVYHNLKNLTCPVLFQTLGYEQVLINKRIAKAAGFLLREYTNLPNETLTTPTVSLYVKQTDAERIAYLSKQFKSIVNPQNFRLNLSMSSDPGRDITLLKNELQAFT